VPRAPRASTAPLGLAGSRSARGSQRLPAPSAVVPPERDQGLEAAPRRNRAGAPERAGTTGVSSVHVDPGWRNRGRARVARDLVGASASSIRAAPARAWYRLRPVAARPRRRRPPRTRSRLMGHTRSAMTGARWTTPARRAGGRPPRPAGNSPGTVALATMAVQREAWRVVRSAGGVPDNECPSPPRGRRRASCGAPEVHVARRGSREGGCRIQQPTARGRSTWKPKTTPAGSPPSTAGAR
jgi:hypothetical protein